jgi:hypothetical protein
MLYVFSFWVIPRRLNFLCRRFGTLCLFHLHRQVGMKNNSSYYYSSYPPAYADGTDRVFRNVGIQNSDAGELPRKKKKHTTLFCFVLRKPEAKTGTVYLYPSVACGRKCFLTLTSLSICEHLILSLCWVWNILPEDTI